MPLGSTTCPMPHSPQVPHLDHAVPYILTLCLLHPILLFLPFLPPPPTFLPLTHTMPWVTCTLDQDTHCCPFTPIDLLCSGLQSSGMDHTHRIATPDHCPVAVTHETPISHIMPLEIPSYTHIWYTFLKRLWVTRTFTHIATLMPG